MKKLNKYTFDAGIFPLIFAGEAKVKPYMNEVARGEAEALACEINLGEFYNKTCERKGKSVADTLYFQLRRQPRIIIVAPDEKLTRTAGLLKCKYREKVSLADCYAAATASVNKSCLITSDRPLAEVAKLENIHVKFIEVQTT